MTDLTKGIIEIDGFAITPEITPVELERHFEGSTTRTVNRFNPSIVTFRKPIYINFTSMTFINFEIDFRDGKIEKIELISDLKNYGVDENGKKTYSPEKEDECRAKLVEWGIKSFGNPTHKELRCWNYKWGCLKIGTRECSNKFYIEYGKNYSL